MTNRRALYETFLTLPGPKVTIWGFRWHHGLFGLQVIAAALLLPARFTLTRSRLTIAGALLALHDIRDWRDWFRGRWT